MKDLDAALRMTGAGIKKYAPSDAYNGFASYICQEDQKHEKQRGFSGFKRYLTYV